MPLDSYNDSEYILFQFSTMKIDSLTDMRNAKILNFSFFDDKNRLPNFFDKNRKIKMRKKTKQGKIKNVI